MDRLPASIGALTGLQSLGIRGAPSRKHGPRTLPAEVGALARLEHLDASSNRLTALPPELLRLARLEHLNLCRNRLAAGAVPPGLAALPRLRFLCLDGDPPVPADAPAGEEPALYQAFRDVAAALRQAAAPRADQ